MSVSKGFLLAGLAKKAGASEVADLDASAVKKTADVGSLILPSGLEAERDLAPKGGYTRFNETTESPEVYYRDKWRALPTDPDDVGFDVIALFGQSNMVGYGASRSDYLDLEDSRIWQFCDLGRNNSLDAGIWYRQMIKAREPLEHERKGGTALVGPGLAFAREYVRSIAPNRKVLLVPAASGSTGFAENHWTVGGQFFENAMNQLNLALTAAGPNSRFVGMCWVQGEQDAIKAMTGPAYQAAWRAMWAEIKLRTNTPDAWAVLGSMVHEWTFNSDLNVARANKIRIWDQHAALPGVEERVWFVQGPTGAASSNSAADLIHYNAAAMRTLGRDMYHKGYLEAIRNKEERPALVRGLALNGNVTIGIRAEWTAQFNVQYDLRWRYVGLNDWTAVNGITGVSVLIAAGEGREVEVQVRAFRGVGAAREEGPWSASARGTSTPTLLQGLLFRMTPAEIEVDTFNGAYPTSSETGGKYVKRWRDRSGKGRHFETVIHGSTFDTTNVTMTTGSTAITVVANTGIFVGSVIYADGIPYATTVTAINGTALTISAPATKTQTVPGEFYKPLSRNYNAAVTQNAGFGRPRFAVVDGIDCVVISNEYKALWNKIGIVGNNSYTKTWLFKHVAINNLPGEVAVANDGGAIAYDAGSKNYTSCYVNTPTTGTNSTLTWRTGAAGGGHRLNFAHNGLNAQAVDATDMSLTNWMLITCSFDRATGLMQVYRNGVLGGQFTNTSALASFSMYLGGIDLGPFRAGATGAAFAELITHDRVLTADDTATLAEYMRAEYKVTLG